MASSVTLDTSDLIRVCRQLETRIGRVVDDTSRSVAAGTAAAIRADVPKRSGRLASSVGSVDQPDGAAVTYGGGIPYANYIERRSHAVANNVRDAESRFVTAITTATVREVNSL